MQFGAPAFGDIDGDGEVKVVVASYMGSSSGHVYACKKNGTMVTGFPINTGYIWGTPTLADLDNDGAMEIIVNKRDYPQGQVLIFKGNGTMFPGWPQEISTVPGASDAVGDINNDNIPEIICEALDSLYVWEPNGTLLKGFPFGLPGSEVFSYAAPTLADLDGDNNKEIIFGDFDESGNLNGHVYVLKNNGTIYPGWPTTTSYWVYSSPSVGYINDDDILDIAVGDQTLSQMPVNNIYAWDSNGNLLQGFPSGPHEAINAQVILADVDNDNSTELIFDDNSGLTDNGAFYALHNNGTDVS